MKLKYIKRVTLSVVIILCLSVTTFYATVTQEQIDQVKDQVNQLQQQVDDAENELNQFNSQKESLEGDLDDFNSQMDALVNDMYKLEGQIDIKQDEIAVTSSELEEAEKQVEKQHKDMMRRIQYMYENGSTSMMNAIFGSDSIAEMINQTNYVSLLVLSLFTTALGVLCFRLGADLAGVPHSVEHHGLHHRQQVGEDPVHHHAHRHGEGED